MAPALGGGGADSPLILTTSPAQTGGQGFSLVRFLALKFAELAHELSPPLGDLPGELPGPAFPPLPGLNLLLAVALLGL